MESLNGAGHSEVDPLIKVMDNRLSDDQHY